MSTRNELRDRLRDAHLALLFTPSVCGDGDPLEILEAALPHVDIVQVRIKHPDDPAWNAPARDVAVWTERVLDVVSGDVLVFVNDRVDVAKCYARRGVHGVHVGADDCPAEVARRVVGEELLIGVSTHGAADVARSEADDAIDTVGFGPIHATPTKGYTRGLGSEAAWIAASGTNLPLFPIGGIDATNVAELVPIRRAAVSSAILAATDPGGAARTLRELLLDGER